MEIMKPAASSSNRSFPELRDFLEKEILGVDFPVKHLIEQARNKGHISKGKPGRGGAKVTSRDVAILIAGALSGDTPQTATDNMALIEDLKSGDTSFAAYFPTFGDSSDDDSGDKWWEGNFLQALTRLIDVCREDRIANLDDLTITVRRSPNFFARIAWEDTPWDRDVTVGYGLPETDERAQVSKGRRMVEVSLNGDFLRVAANWLEDRSPYCEVGPYRDLGSAL